MENKISNKDESKALHKADVTSSGRFTWNDLLEAINKLPAEERLKQVHINIDDESTFRKVAGLETIQADVYVNNDDDEDCGDLETLKDAHGEDFKLEDYRLATHKGHPFLWNEF